MTIGSTTASRATARSTSRRRAGHHPPLAPQHRRQRRARRERVALGPHQRRALHAGTRGTAGRVDHLARARRARCALTRTSSPLQGDVDELAHLRSQRDLSLNLEKRRAERDAIDAERLKRENARRAARGLEPLANISALNDAEAPDAVLDEAVEIAADAVQLPKLQEPARLS